MAKNVKNSYHSISRIVNDKCFPQMKYLDRKKCIDYVLNIGYIVKLCCYNWHCFIAQPYDEVQSICNVITQNKWRENLTWITRSLDALRDLRVKRN